MKTSCKFNNGTRNILLLGILSIVSLFSPAQENSSPLAIEYELVKDWPLLPLDGLLGQPSGLGIDVGGNLLVFHRARATPGSSSKISMNTIAKLDAKTGELMESWGANLFVWPHGLTVDHKGNVWVTDVGQHQVFKFSSDGALLMVIGEQGIVGDNRNHFNKPSDVAVANDGSFYVSDGYGNSRVVKFSAEGEYLFEWGGKGKAEGQFDLPHSIIIDREENIIVADRENARIQKFDCEGTFLEEWQNDIEAKVYAVQVGKDRKSVYAVDFLIKNDTLIVGSNISIFDAHLLRHNYFGYSGNYNGAICRYHDIEIDKHQNIYVADLLNNLVQKFSPIVK